MAAAVDISLGDWYACACPTSSALCNCTQHPTQDTADLSYTHDQLQDQELTSESSPDTLDCQEKQRCGLVHNVSLGGFMLKMLRAFQSRSRDSVRMRELLAMVMSYVNRVKQAVPSSYYCNHCLFLISLILTQKVSYDNLAMSNADFSRQADVPLKHINRYESWVLRVLDYKLNVDLTDAHQNKFDVVSQLEQHANQYEYERSNSEEEYSNDGSNELNAKYAHPQAKRLYTHMNEQNHAEQPYLHMIDNFLTLSTEENMHTAQDEGQEYVSDMYSPSSRHAHDDSYDRHDNEAHDTDGDDTDGHEPFMFGVACQYEIIQHPETGNVSMAGSRPLADTLSYSSLSLSSSTDSLCGSDFGLSASQPDTGAINTLPRLDLQINPKLSASSGSLGSSSSEFLLGAGSYRTRTPNRFNPYGNGAGRPTAGSQRIAVYH